MSHNIQEDNAGNLGDIVKHGALVALAGMLRERNAEVRINYVDTHAFKLRTRMPNAERWLAETRVLLLEYPCYQEYVHMETPSVEAGEYLCSVGLALQALPGCNVFLAERSSQTRSELEGQLNKLGAMPTALAGDMHDLAHMNLESQAGPVLALVDPFFEAREEWLSTWRSASAIVGALRSDKGDGVILVFQYHKDELPTWLGAPEGFEGPVAVANCKPYYLAAYGTSCIKEQTASTLARMGWNTTTEEDPVLTLDGILDLLHDRGQRATYCAVGQYLGLIPREVGRRMGLMAPCPRCSWVVHADTGLPPDPPYGHAGLTDSRLPGSPPPITTGDSLRAWIGEQTRNR